MAETTTKDRVGHPECPRGEDHDQHTLTVGNGLQLTCEGRGPADLVEKVAQALYRQSRVEEWYSSPGSAPDAATYAGWFPWERLGSKQIQWRDRAKVAIEAMEIPEIRIDTEGDGPTTCRITYRGVLMFDGVERGARC